MSAITKEMVFEAAAALVEAGLTPKVATVREKLGKGSYTTINEFMREWREGQKAPEAPVRDVMPPAVADRLVLFGNELWGAAVALATESLKSEREALEALKAEMDEEQRETVAFADGLASEVERLYLQNEELTGFLEIEKEAHQATRNLYQVETDEVIRLTAQAESNARHMEEDRARIERLSADYQAATERERQQAAEIARLEAKLANAEENKERANQERGQAVEAAEKAREAAHAAEIVAAKLNGEVESLQKQMEKQAKQFDTLAASLKKEAAAKKTTKDDAE